MTDGGENYQKEKEEKENENQKRTITKGWENPQMASEKKLI